MVDIDRVKALCRMALEDLFSCATFNSELSFVDQIFNNWTIEDLLTAYRQAFALPADRPFTISPEDHRQAPMDDDEETHTKWIIFHRFQQMLRNGRALPIYLEGINSRLLDFDNPGYGCPNSLCSLCDITDDTFNEAF